MKHYIQIEKPATTEQRLQRTECDICSAQIEEIGWSDVRESSVKLGVRRHIDVELRMGHSYGSDGGEIESHEFDVCVDCFRDKLAPFIESHRGATGRKSKIDW